jgi:hypothetical protein
MTAVAVLRLSLFTLCFLPAVLVYAIADAVVHGLILIPAVVVFVSGLVLNQIVRIITAFPATSGAVSRRHPISRSQKQNTG